MSEEESGGEPRDFRRMVEEIAVTPFFRHHRRHMPATLKLHAEVREEKDKIVLETKLSGFEEEDVDVDATANTINIRLRFEEEGKEDVFFHNSYFTPTPVDPSGLSVVHKDGVLRVVVPKRAG